MNLLGIRCYYILIFIGTELRGLYLYSFSRNMCDKLVIPNAMEKSNKITNSRYMSRPLRELTEYIASAVANNNMALLIISAIKDGYNIIMTITYIIFRLCKKIEITGPNGWNLKTTQE